MEGEIRNKYQDLREPICNAFCRVTFTYTIFCVIHDMDPSLWLCSVFQKVIQKDLYVIIIPSLIQANHPVWFAFKFRWANCIKMMGRRGGKLFYSLS